MEAVAAAPLPAPPLLSVAHQYVELDIDFRSRKVSGRTEITIHPQSKDLKSIALNLRQSRIKRLTVNGKSVSRMQYTDPHTKAYLAGNPNAHQHHLLSSKLAGALKSPPQGELTFDVPRSIRIEELNLNSISASQATLPKKSDGNIADTPLADSADALADASIARFTPLVINIGFDIDEVRDGLHFVAHGTGAGRFPQAYTPQTNVPGGASCLFPCVDALHARCTWDITIKCPRTVGDALRSDTSQDTANPETAGQRPQLSPSAHEGREMTVVCTGEDVSRTEDKLDSSKAIFSFSCMSALSAQQIGFAIGPFEEIKLSDIRLAEDDVGQNAVQVLGYCLPGRADELRTTCLPTVRAMDFVTLKYVACPFKSYRMCFVDDLENDTAIAGALTLCSNRLLYPADIIDTAEAVTRKLVHAIVSQWMGINIVPQQPTDTWIVVGIAHYITEAFMKELCGNNEYRARMKLQSDQVCEMDHNRPSLSDLGILLQIDPSELEFLSLKAPLVLFILDRRIAKVVGLPKMPAIISKILLRARKGELSGSALSTELFQKTCERFYHNKIDDFLTQWVRGGGCPHFRAFQKFNKKKLVVEMVIRQVQGESASRDLEPDTFMRDVREDFHNTWAAPVQNVFTGPITIRVHEADGTPYEHVVDIREPQMRFEIPYNTKYKRLKRSRRQREKNVTVISANADQSEIESDALLYCLGDVLQSEDDLQKWRIAEWTAEDEEKMSSESYEWIRVDADFEWICKMDLSMAGYMYTSQLQQDRDVVAQMDSIRAITIYPPSRLISSIYLRTVMDKRYFYRVRTVAAMSMAREATQETDYIGFWQLRKAFEELYCSSDSNSMVARPNNFSNPADYQVQCGLIRAIAEVRDAKGIALPEVIEFLLDKLKFNNNDTNQFSDCFYVSVLMRSLCDAVVTFGQRDRHHVDEMDLDALDRRDRDRLLERECLSIIDRYRRMDEWANSYQNLYSRTAIDCQRRLSDCNIGSLSAMHFLQYTRPGNYDMLRQVAFDNLMQPTVLHDTAVLRYLTFCMSSDPSPWIRACLRKSFGKLLAVVAIGDHLKNQQLGDTDDLEIVQGSSAENQQAQTARKRVVETAILALKAEVGDNEHLKTSLWAAVTSKLLSLDELQAMLDFCRMLYEPVDSFMVTMHYPRYWRLDRMGKGKLKFSRSDQVRTKRFVKWVPKSQQPPPPPPPPPPVVAVSATKKYDLLPPKSTTTTAAPRLSFKNPAPPPPAAAATLMPQRPPPPPLREKSTAPAPGTATGEARSGLKLKISMPKPASG